MNPLTEVEILHGKLRKALSVMDFHKENFEESEVIFRLESVKGMLIIALNDATVMKKLWQADHDRQLEGKG